jgi:DNA-binding IclR family transcriptional regulator
VTSPTGRTSIQVIERMMDLVETLAANAEPMNLKRLASETGLHTSTAHRILAMMVDHRIVDRVEPGTYRLGTRLMELGHIVRSRIDLRAEAMPVMQVLHQELHETVNLSVRQGDEMVYVERLVSDRQAMRVAHVIGARAPLHVTAVGKIFLLEDGPDLCREYAVRTRLAGLTRNTICDQATLARELEKIRKSGYAFDHEEAEVGVSCVGAGIRDDEQKLVAGLSVSAPSNRLDKTWGPRIREAADQISRAIGWVPPRA